MEHDNEEYNREETKYVGHWNTLINGNNINSNQSSIPPAPHSAAIVTPEVVSSKRKFVLSPQSKIHLPNFHEEQHNYERQHPMLFHAHPNIQDDNIMPKYKGIGYKAPEEKERMVLDSKYYSERLPNGLSRRQDHYQTLSHHDKLRKVTFCPSVINPHNHLARQCFDPAMALVNLSEATQQKPASQPSPASHLKHTMITPYGNNYRKRRKVKFIIHMDSYRAFNKSDEKSDASSAALNVVIRSDKKITRSQAHLSDCNTSNDSNPLHERDAVIVVPSDSQSSFDNPATVNVSSTCSTTSLSPMSFYGNVPLASHTDHKWLSDLNCLTRRECVEAFSAGSEDAALSSKRGKILEGQVGIRCVFCKHIPVHNRFTGAVSYPVSIFGIYDSVKRLQRIHLFGCPYVSQEMKDRLEDARSQGSSVHNARQYWIDSAKALGMIDTNAGIRFCKNPSSTLSKYNDESTENQEANNTVESSLESSISECKEPLVYRTDLKSVPLFVYRLMEQVERCVFTEEDRFIARSKGAIGKPGFQCRHCAGRGGCGKYFPCNSKALSTNSTSQNILTHVLKCSKCPDEIKNDLIELKSRKDRRGLGPGWRRDFFELVWDRLQQKEEESTLKLEAKK